MIGILFISIAKVNQVTIRCSSKAGIQDGFILFQVHAIESIVLNGFFHKGAAREYILFSSAHNA